MHLDTPFLIDLQHERERRQPGACHEFLGLHGDVPIRISAIAAMEYLEGFSDAEVAGQLPFLAAFDRVSIDLPESVQASRIRRELRLIGQLIPDNDILIAACAIHQQEPLVTDNTAHFRRIPGLQLLSYKS